MVNSSALRLASLDNLPIGYIVTDVDHKVELINYAARELLATTGQITTLEEVVVHLPKRLALLDHVRYCSIEHKSCSFREVQLGERVVRVFLSPIFLEDELKGNLLTLEDITEKIAQERARDEFLAFLVHEFRTPLTAIHGNSVMMTQYYAAALQDPALRDMVTDITLGSDYLLAMVNQFLDMARLEEGRIEYELQAFDLAKLLQETVSGLEVLAKEHQLQLTLNPSGGDEVQVVADPQRTKQVITNLIGNAIKFTEHGGISVELAPGEANVEVLVRDTGTGIPADSQAKLFQKFYQAGNNKLRRDSAKSTGLGLYATRLMVEGMGGKIRLASSEPGVGSVFAFSLDLATPERLKRLEKQNYDAKQGVMHAPAPDHHSSALHP